MQGSRTPRHLPSAPAVMLACLLASAAAAHASGKNPPFSGPLHLWAGLYQESPSADPGPTAGMLLACMPHREGHFHGYMILSFTGCAPGIDIGFVEGTVGPSQLDRSVITGRWRGVVDGLQVRGAFEGTLEHGHWGPKPPPDGPPPQSVATGRWQLDGGGRLVSLPDPQGGQCQYHIAAGGTWRMQPPGASWRGMIVGRQDNYAETAAGHLNLVWNSPLPSDAYVVALLDPEVLCRQLDQWSGKPPAELLAKGVLWAGATDARALRLAGAKGRVPPGRRLLEAFRGDGYRPPTAGQPIGPLAFVLAGRLLLSEGGFQHVTGYASMPVLFTDPGLSMGSNPLVAPHWAH